MKETKPEKQSLLSMDPDKADKTGFLHGVRATIAKFRAILYNYPNKDGIGATNDDGSEVQAPGYMVDFEVKGGDGKTWPQFYANGSADQRVPNKAGTGFVLAKGSTVKSALNEGSNAFLLIASLKSCGWPSANLGGDCSVFDGAVVDLIAQPVGQTKRALAEGQKPRTIAVVGKIVSFPDGVEDTEGAADDDEEEDTPAPVKAKKPAKPAPDEDDDDDEDEDETPEAATDDDDEDEAPAPKKSHHKKPAPAPVSDDDEDEDEDDAADPLTTTAQEHVAAVLQSKKYRGKSIDLPTLSKEVLVLARADKNRQKIVALVQDPAFHKAAAEFWTYDRKAKTISADTE